MLNQIKGLHHVTSFAGDAQANNAFWTRTLGLRRVKKTVNFDAPDVYHLYYGDEAGTPGSVMTYFPFPNMAPGRPGTGEVGTTVFSVPEGALPYWRSRFGTLGVEGVKDDTAFGETRLHFAGVDGDSFALVEAKGDTRAPWARGSVPSDYGIRGFHAASMRLRDDGATVELLKFMGYEVIGRADGVTRLAVKGDVATVIDVETMPNIAPARPGAGTVHHIAFAVADRAAHLEVRKAIADTGYMVTPVIDRDYFWSIYFRTPGGVLFEIATNEPGFARDEDAAHLGEQLRLPKQHEHLRGQLEKSLQPITDATE